MRDGKMAIVGILGALVGVFLGVLATLSFMFLRPISPPAKSAFYSACSDWSTVLDKSHPGNEVVVKNKLPGGSSESVRGQRSYRTQAMRCDVSTNKRGIDQLMRGLSTNLKQLAQQTGAEIDDDLSNSVRLRSGAEDDYLASFEIQYTAANAHGRVSASVDEGKAQPEKPGIEVYHLSVRIEEWVR